MAKNRIKVYARLKPEKNLMNYRVLHRPKENPREDMLVLISPTEKSKDYLDNRPETWNFSFFRIFEECASQKDVFESVAQPVVESALDGYNGTIFAYGQTASGKTHTITGTLESENCGIIPRSLRYLFDAMQKRPENVYSVEVAYLEIYNETGYDLLDRRQQAEFAVARLQDLPRINIFEDEFGKLRLKNLTFHCVRSVNEAFELLLLGDNNRVIAETPMNPRSSRSHCIFTIVVCTKRFDSEQCKRAKVHLVDLAGSERVYKCSISGTILTEAKHINLSLHYLEQVIVCLGQESVAHVPYRNSLLTSILRDSLGGNCITAMLATISLTSFNLQETLSTCRFSQRVALIKNDLKFNFEIDVRSENALLRAENERLRQRIEALANRTVLDQLTAEDKKDLDDRVARFLESNEQVCWDYDPERVLYCFETFKRVFKLNRDSKGCSKELRYYKDLVLQKDNEISLLTATIKKEREQRLDTLSIDNSQTARVESVANCTVSKKPKRTTKTNDSCKANCYENISRNQPIANGASKSDLLPCNVVNLTLNDLVERENRTTEQRTIDKFDEAKRHTVGKFGGKLKKRNHEMLSKIESNDFENPARLSTEEETNYSAAVLQKFLTFDKLRSPKEETVAVKENRRIGNEDSSGRWNGYKDTKRFENSLPLTGDPEIDEEIVAFYKAKQSGASY